MYFNLCSLTLKTGVWASQIITTKLNTAQKFMLTMGVTGMMRTVPPTRTGTARFAKVEKQEGKKIEKEKCHLSEKTLSFSAFRCVA